MPTRFRVRGSYHKPWSKLAKEPLSTKDLQNIGRILVKVFSEEARKDFARRGWSLRAPHSSTSVGGVQPPGKTSPPSSGGPPIDKSFGFQIKANQIEITSSYYGLEALLRGVPRHPMPWLTQEAARKHHPASRGPLVVPLRGPLGTVLFRVAPERIADAWIHPGIRRLTFGDRAVRKVKEQIEREFIQIAQRKLAAGDPTL